jgi:osmotically inducible protein OsmC
MSIHSRAAAGWSGNLIAGHGEVSTKSSNAFTDLPITWAARTEDHGGLTSPEELVAAAHAACYAMAFASNLTKAGTPPTHLDVAVDVTFDKLDAWTLTNSDLTVRGTVPGISATDFASIAEMTKDTCPISRALKGNVAMTVEAVLEG